MAKLTDLQKAINAIKKIVGNPKMIITDEILTLINDSLGFTVSIATITENTKEQQIIYENKVVDDVFLLNYITKNKKYIMKTSLLNIELTELQKFKLIFIEIMLMIREEYNASEFSMTHLLLDKNTQAERIAWDSLYRYVKYNVMGYEIDQLLEKRIVQKLKELQTGRILGNNKQVAICRYSFDDILLAFKFCYFDIQKAVKTKNFDNNVKKFNYICAIVKDNINTVIERTKAKQEANERLLRDDFDCIDNPRAKYVRRTEECLPELEDLW